MFELIAGYHPLYEDGDTRFTLETKLKNYTDIKLPHKMSQPAKHLISCLLQRNISLRYSADKSLTHPFITRNLEEALPMTNAEFKRESVKSFQLEGKIRRAINVFLVCGVVQMNLPSDLSEGQPPLSQQSTSGSTRRGEPSSRTVAGISQFESYKKMIKEVAGW